MQPDTEQRPHKISYHVSLKGTEATNAVEELQERLRQKGVSTKVIYSGGEDLDILPQQASKGKGLEFLLKEVSHPIRTSWKAIMSTLSVLSSLQDVRSDNSLLAALKRDWDVLLDSAATNTDRQLCSLFDVLCSILSIQNWQVNFVIL